MHIIPPLPQDREERRALIEIWCREIRVIRRRPGFIIGMAMAALSAFSLIFLVGGNISRLVILVGIFGAATVYDNVTRHFCGVILRGRPSTPDAGPSHENNRAAP